MGAKEDIRRQSARYSPQALQYRILVFHLYQLFSRRCNHPRRGVVCSLKPSRIIYLVRALRLAIKAAAGWVERFCCCETPGLPAHFMISHARVLDIRWSTRLAITSCNIRNVDLFDVTNRELRVLSGYPNTNKATSRHLQKPAI